MKCHYYGCPEDVPNPDPTFDAETMQFCPTHCKEFDELSAKAEQEPERVLGFWVRAKGGANRLTDEIFGFRGSHDTEANK